MFKKKEEAPSEIAVNTTTYTEYARGKLTVEKRESPYRNTIVIRYQSGYSVDIPYDELANLKELLDEVE